MKVINHLGRRHVIAAVVACVALCNEANASGAIGWWGGTWNCNIDGRPAQMKWAAVNVDDGECSDGTCTTSSSATWKGSFSDNGSAWVPLNNPRKGEKGGLFFNHADGNRWYLPEPKQTRVGMRSVGWTTWQGNRYKLTCWR